MVRLQQRRNGLEGCGFESQLLTKCFIVKSLLNTPPTPNIVVYPIVMYVSYILYDCHTENHFLRLLQNFKKF